MALLQNGLLCGIAGWWRCATQPLEPALVAQLLRRYAAASISSLGAGQQAATRFSLGRRAQMAEQGIADAQGAFAPAIDHMRGCRIPKITHIRACGAHVCRMEKCTLRSVRQCGIRCRTWRSRPLSVRTFTENFYCSHPDEAREAMGRYQGTPGGSVIPYIHPSHALRPEDRTESVLR